MPGLLTDLSVAGALAVRAANRRLRSATAPAPDLDQFQQQMQKLVDAAGSAVAQSCWLTLPADRPPWTPSGLTVEAGAEVSYFMEGRVYANRLLDIWVAPTLQVWSKIGDTGTIFRGTRRSFSFRAEQDGPLQFGNYFPNDWSNPQGERQQPDAIYQQNSGEIRILCIRWLDGAREGLQSLLERGDYQGRVQAELQRIDAADNTPAGWHYLWHLGPAEIYQTSETAEGHPCIHCHTHHDAGILQHNVQLPLKANTVLNWRWCIEQLPSTLREDSVPSHDYLSIAVEFDNGRDITYYWSSNLPVGFGYDCPLPNWKGKEFHVVVRSGNKGLGQWLSESRNLYADYRKYMGEPPARIVRVWLIANSVFQRGQGRCDYANITLDSDDGPVRVL